MYRPLNYSLAIFYKAADELYLMFGHVLHHLPVSGKLEILHSLIHIYMHEEGPIIYRC